MMDGWNMTGWGWAWMTLMMVIGVALAALLVVAVLRGTTPAGPRPESRPEPLGDAREILAQRLARGEIDEAEYRRLRAVLDDQRAEAGASHGHA